MFDTHTHLQFKVFENIIDDVVERARKNGVNKIIAVGTNLESSKKAVELSQQFKGIFASVGIHPHHVYEHHHNRENLDSDLKELEKLLQSEEVVAIGETGLDRHLYKRTKYPNYLITNEFIEFQKELFSHQINLAKKYNKSLIIHNRGAVDELLEVLKQNWSEVFFERSVFHCSEADFKLLDFAKEYGVFIGIDGDVTYEREKQKFVKVVPLEFLVLETDSPFFVPVLPGHPLASGSTDSTSRAPLNDRINTPANLIFIAQKIAEIKKINVKEVEEVTFKNAQKLFKL